MVDLSGDSEGMLETYGVLAGVHRGNNLWYNKKLLEKNGITVGDKMGFDEFFAACDNLKGAGIHALGVGDSGIWASAQLFENTLLGVVGPEGWIDLFGGKMKWDDPKVKEAMKYFAKMPDYLNPDHSAGKSLPSCVHGEVAPAAFQQALNDAVPAFIVDKNIDNFANALVQAAKESETNK
jgi:ABC-type glycerol-3-phosphate transport system substrate-binding protein